MESFLQTLVVDQLVVFMMVFARLGTAVMIMPGIGDSFVSERVRLFFALGFSVAIAPVVGPLLPDVTVGSLEFLLLILKEMVVGLFIGTVARIFMTALDTGGMLISMQTGLGNAMVFNPSMAGQGSIIGAFLSVAGTTLLFMTDLHHLVIYAIFESYATFPSGLQFPVSGGMAETISRAVMQSFAIGFYMAVPFFVVSLLLYIGMGVLGRLMPQIQVFILALPLQILLGLLTLFLVLSSVLLYWVGQYEESLQMFLMKL